MAAKRRTANIPQSQRSTTFLAIRAPVELDVAVRADAATHGLTLAQVVGVYRELAVASGQLEVALGEVNGKAE